MGVLLERIERHGHVVVVVAEGAGQNLLAATGEHDASGNVRHSEIGLFLAARIKNHCAAHGPEVNLKYIDPSYTIRSLPANARDAAFCLLMGYAAVHGGMAGKTDMVVGFWKHRLTNVPIPLAVSARKRLDTNHFSRQGVLAATGQPRDMR